MNVNQSAFAIEIFFCIKSFISPEVKFIQTNGVFHIIENDERNMALMIRSLHVWETARKCT